MAEKIKGIGGNRSAASTQEHLPSTQVGNGFAVVAQGSVQLNPELAGKFEDEDFKGIETADLTLPRISIRGKAEGGRKATDFKFYHRALDGSDTVIADQSELVITEIIDHPSRVLFPKPFTTGSKPLCRSIDGKVGVGTPGGDCHACPLSKFGNNGDAPQCGEQREILVYDHRFKGCYVFVLKRRSIVERKLFFEYLQMLGVLKNNPISSFAFKVTASEVASPRGNMYVPVYDKSHVTQIPLDLYEEIRTMRRQLREQFSQTMTDTADDETHNGGQARPVGNDPGGPLPEGVTPVTDENGDLPF